MSYQIKIEPSGHTFTVNPDETVLDAALRQGIGLPYGCRNGRCGGCLGKLVKGEIDYRETPVGISRDEMATGGALFCQAIPKTDLTISARESLDTSEISIKTYPCKIIELARLNHDVMLVKLKLPTGERMRFLAGQYIDFILKDGRKRSFSLANAPHDDDFLVLHVRHIEGGRFTADVFDNMKEKDIQRIEGPLGSFYLREDSNRPIIFMAGGTGFAPIKGIIEHALAARMERPMHLYWGVRAREDLYMHELAESWTRINPLIRYTPVLSDPKSEDNWTGRTGFVHEAIMSDYADLSAYEIYASGPPVMVYAGRDAFVTHGFTLENYFSDAFTYAAD